MYDLLTRPVKPLKYSRKRKPLSQEIENIYKVLMITLIILAITSTGSYLYMNSLKPAKGYTLKQLQINNEILEAELRQWEHQVMQAQSFINIEESETVNEMNEAGDLTYIDESPYASNN